MQEQPTHIEFYKIRDVGQVLNDTLEFIKQNFKILVKSLGFIAVPIYLIFGLIYGYFYASLLSSAPSMFDMYGNVGPITILAFAVFIILFGVTGFTALVSTVYYTMELYQEKGQGNFGYEDVKEKVKQNYGQVAAFALGLALLVVGIFLVIAVVFGIAGFADSSTTSILLTFILALATIIAAIYFYVVLCFVFIVRIHEGLHFFESISKSIRLIRGRFWPTLGLLIILGIIAAAIGFVFNIPSYIVMFSGMMHSLESASFGEAPQISPILMAITNAITYGGVVFGYAIILLAIGFHYFNQVERKEGSGLLGKIEQIGSVE